MIKKNRCSYHICLTLETTTSVLPPDSLLRGDHNIFIPKSRGREDKLLQRLQGRIAKFSKSLSPFHHHPPEVKK